MFDLLILTLIPKCIIHLCKWTMISVGPRKGVDKIFDYLWLMDIDYYFLCFDDLSNINDHKLLGTFLLDQHKCLKSVYMDFCCRVRYFFLYHGPLPLCFSCSLVECYLYGLFLFSSSTTPVVNCLRGCNVYNNLCFTNGQLLFPHHHLWFLGNFFRLLRSETIFTIALLYKRSHATCSNHLNLKCTTLALYSGDTFTISKMSSLTCTIWISYMYYLGLCLGLLLFNFCFFSNF